MVETETYPETQPHFKKPRISEETHFNNNVNLKTKTQLCRRFMQGVCFLGPKCNYAHGSSELRTTTTTTTPKLCRLFLRNKHCSYGHTCRFLHHSSQQSQPVVMKNPGCRMMQTCAAAAATIDGNSSAQNKIMQTSTTSTTPTTNASTSTVATSSLHKNGPYGVKFIFKKKELQKISGIYADWI